jgi:hypothetical protein
MHTPTSAARTMRAEEFFEVVPEITVERVKG